MSCFQRADQSMSCTILPLAVSRKQDRRSPFRRWFLTVLGTNRGERCLQWLDGVVGAPLDTRCRNDDHQRYLRKMSKPEFDASESAVLSRYFTNLDRPVFALRNLPEVVKGALFSRYSRTEKSLRRVLLDEFINEPDSGFDRLAGTPPVDDDMVAVRRAAEVYGRVLGGYGSDAGAELAGAHVAGEQTS